MNTTLHPGEHLLLAVRRMLVAQLDEVASILRKPKLSDDAIHRVRKQLKRARAGLRLLRPSLGDAGYRRHNQTLRDIARPLTPIRDAKVLLATANELWIDVRASAEQNVIAKLHQALQQERAASRKCFTRKDVATALARLRSLKQHIQAIPDHGLSEADVTIGLGHAYKKARKAFAAARRRAADERLHEWRKQVKYFLNQLELLQPLKPKRFGKLIKQAGIVAALLGDDHDLAILHRKLIQPSVVNLAAATLIEKLQRKRTGLQRRSQHLGRKLFKEPPSAVRRQFSKYLTAWTRSRAPTYRAAAATCNPFRLIARR